MIYLASSSPRRAELLRQIGVKFDIIRVDIDETPHADEKIDALVERLSREKALHGCQQLESMAAQDRVLAADTLIGLDQRIIGKPQSHHQCGEILHQLSGRQHQVYSCVALADRNGLVNSRLSVNEITFRSIDAEEIADYCASSEPMDKAGAYAIQGRAAVFIRQLSGSYSAVMGLPLFETAELLQQAGYRI